MRGLVGNAFVWTVLWGVLALVGAGCAGPAAGAGAAEPDGLQHADALEGEEQACSRDVECALVDDCCGCARGGLRMSVRTDMLEAVTERSESACAERTCSEQPSQHRSCTATAARCLGGRCLPAL
jgi:hypothetical protein